MITCTSEMSGSASSGMWPIDQIPASVRRSTPVKTRKRLCAHNSMIREITLHTSRGVNGELLVSDGLSVLLRADGDLPRSARAEITLAFVHSATFIAGSDDSLHCSHPHRGHCCHIEGHGHTRTPDWLSIPSCDLYADGVAAFVRRIGIRRQLHIGLLLCRCIHGSGLSGSWRRRHESGCGRLQLRFGINQEVCGGDDMFFRLEARADYDLVTDLRPKSNLTRRDIAFALINEDQVPGSRTKCRRTW